MTSPVFIITRPLISGTKDHNSFSTYQQLPAVATISLAFKMAVIRDGKPMMAYVKRLILPSPSDDRNDQVRACVNVVVAQWKEIFNQFWKFVEVHFYSWIFARWVEWLMLSLVTDIYSPYRVIQKGVPFLCDFLHLSLFIDTQWNILKMYRRKWFHVVL